ncbi:MAG: winged helix-turn-helix domain-containing protein [Candidatus Hodarchaeota archaeon]
MSIPSEKVIIQAIAHNIRREALRIIFNQPQTFTDLLNYFDISSGKLTYHLNQIKGFVTKNEENKYVITPLGKRVLEILDIINHEISEADQPLLKEAFLSQKETGKPLALQGVNIALGMISFIIVIHLIISIVALSTPDTPFLIYPILFILLLGEILMLIWLLRVRKSTPAFLERFFKHIGDVE